MSGDMRMQYNHLGTEKHYRTFLHNTAIHKIFLPTQYIDLTPANDSTCL